MSYPMICSEETLANAVHEIQSAYDSLPQSDEPYEHRDFALESTQWLWALQERLAQVEPLDSVVTYGKLAGPFPQGFYIVTVYLMVELALKPKKTVFNCVNVAQRVPLLPPLSSENADASDKSIAIDIDKDDVDDVDDKTDSVQWQLQLPSKCNSKEELKVTLQSQIQKMRYFYVTGRAQRNDLRGVHDYSVSDCKGYFRYVPVGKKYQLETCRPHTCCKKV